MRRAKINDFVDIDRIVRAWQSHFTLSISPESIMEAFFSWAIHLADLPGKKTELLTEYLIKYPSISNTFRTLRWALNILAVLSRRLKTCVLVTPSGINGRTISFLKDSS